MSCGRGGDPGCAAVQRGAFPTRVRGSNLPVWLSSVTTWA